jgi:hypothetical protein
MLSARNRSDVVVTVAVATLLWAAAPPAGQANPRKVVELDCERAPIAPGWFPPGWIKMCGKHPDDGDVCLCELGPQSDSPRDPAVLEQQQRLLQQELQRRAEQARQKHDEIKARGGR